VADEHPHAASGYLYWSSGRFAGGIDNPPLGQLWIAAPLVLLERAGLAYRFPDDAFLLAMRIPNVITTLLLGVVLAAWGRRLAGAWGGPAVVAAFVLEPNMLAHGHLATLDAPVTLAWWWALWCFRSAIAPMQPDDATRRPALGFAIATAAAVHTKFSGFLLLPSCAAVLLLTASRDRGRAGRGLLLLLAALVAVTASSYLVYAFESTRGLPPQWVDAISRKLQHRDQGHAAYLLGQQSLHGFLHYYPIVLLVKTPLPLVLLAAAGAWLGRRRMTRLDAALLAVPALVALVVFTWMRVHIGVRHVLMVYPALVLCAGIGGLELWRRGRAARIGLVVLVAAWGTGVAQAAPRWVSYFNVVAGGGRHGDRWLLDSNLDWGQDDARLARFLAARAPGPPWQINPDGEHVGLGRIVVNANTLHALLRPARTAYWWLRPLVPEAYAGDAWRAYTLDVAAFEAGARAAPHDVDAQAALAEALFRDGQADAAARAFDAAARMFGDAPRLAASAAWMHFERGEPDQALAWLERGLRREPQHAALQRQRQRATLELEVASAPALAESAGAALKLGLWWAAEGDIGRALPWFQTAASSGQPDATAACAIGLTQTGRFADAAAVLTGAGPGFDAEQAALQQLLTAEREVQAAAAGDVRIDPVRAYDLAHTYFAAQRYDAAAGVLVQLLRQAPHHRDALALLGELQVRVKLRLVRETLTPRTLSVRAR
jgi:4-amino-4-deoxy-L-arabinose transferase-like glycosyltransferase/tetratricopeptide (TPR) repeat protein